jgi:LPS-assembly lipoprotein
MTRTLLTRRLLTLGALAGGASLLGGCGFQPVYMPTASGKAGPPKRELATVFVRIIPDRPGQLLRLALQDDFASDSGIPPQYDLAVSYSISGEAIGIETTAIATRIRFIGNASWQLLAHDAKSSRLTGGSARYMDGINTFDGQYFASDLETEAVQQRIANEIAQQITIQLAIWFRQQADKQASRQPANERQG